jgi:hypothetical protein
LTSTLFIIAFSESNEAQLHCPKSNDLEDGYLHTVLMVFHDLDSFIHSSHRQAKSFLLLRICKKPDTHEPTNIIDHNPSSTMLAVYQRILEPSLRETG